MGERQSVEAGSAVSTGYVVTSDRLDQLSSGGFGDHFREACCTPLDASTTSPQAADKRCLHNRPAHDFRAPATKNVLGSLDAIVTEGQPSVTHILASLQPSGMERMLVAAAPYWSETGWEVNIIGQGDDHPYANALISAGYHIEYVRSLRTRAGLGDLARVLRATRPDVVHIHTEAAHGPVSLVARIVLPKARLVRTVHSLFRFRGIVVVRRCIQHAIARMVGTHHVAPSSDVAHNERENWGLSCQVIENWVSDEFAQGGSSTYALTSRGAPLRVVMVGNCAAVKNHQVVLSAALMLPRVVVVHVGDNSAMTDDEGRAGRQLGSKFRLELLGVRLDVATILNDSQVFAMPSLHEGMGVALAEALCIGLPCIVSDAPGLRWAHDEPGVLVARDINDWVNILGRLSDDDLFRSSVASAARAGAIRQRERFSARRGVAEYVAIYTDARGDR